MGNGAPARRAQATTRLNRTDIPIAVLAVFVVLEYRSVVIPVSRISRTNCAIQYPYAKDFCCAAPSCLFVYTPARHLSVAA